MGIIDSIFAGIQYLLPHHLLSRVVYYFMRIRIGVIKDLQIWIVGWLVGVNWEEARSPHAREYSDFNAFFTRELASGTRPLDPDPSSYVSPSDGRISQCGRITTDRLVQAKGHHYSIRSLLGND